MSEQRFNRNALVVIDLQNEFLSENGRFPILESSKQTLLTNLNCLIPRFRIAGGHIVWITSIYDHESPPADEEALGEKVQSEKPDTHTGKTPCCEAGSWNAEMYAAATALTDSSDTNITKTYYSAFKNTSLLRTLDTLEIKDVYFCGLLSGTCVLRTVLDAVPLLPARNIHVVADCLGYRREKSHLDALERMKKAEIDLRAGHELIAEIYKNKVLSVPELYYVNGSIPSWRVQLALYEKSLEVNEIRMRVMAHPKPTRLPSFLALNQRGKTPVFVDNDPERTTVNESLAILMYLETYYPEVPLLPPLDQRKYRARVLSLMQETENLHSAYDALEDAFFKAREAGTVEEFESVTRSECIASLKKELWFWENYTSRSSGYIAGGEEFTLADCAFYPLLGYMMRRGFEIDEWPGLKRYQARVWARQSAQRAQPAGWSGRGKADVFKGSPLKV